MRNISIVEGEYYHIFNRGNNKQQIFLDNKDWVRFLFLIIYLQSPMIFQNISREVNDFVKNRVFNINKKDLEEILKDRYVSLIGFAIMPNHFHLILYGQKENGISQYMQRVLCAYTKYFNTKYKKNGHLFQGPYKAVHIKDNKQLLYLSSYIHKNPQNIKQWKNRAEFYPWSSYQDYTKENRWGNLLTTDLIADQFSDRNDYLNFVKSSTAKDFSKNLGEEILFDY